MNSSSIAFTRVVRALSVVTGIGIALGVSPSPQFMSQSMSVDHGRRGAISGIVIDAISKQPVAAAHVYLSSSFPSRGQISDAQGRFVFDELRAGSYSLSASKPGYIASQLTRAASAPGEGQAAGLLVAEGQWIQDVQVQLRRPSVITGTVRGYDAQPIVSGIVRLLVGIAVGGQNRVAAGPITKTDDRGVYRFGDLPAGNYYVCVPNVQSSFPTSTVAALYGVSPESAATFAARDRPLVFDEPVGGRDDQVFRVFGRFPHAPDTPDGRPMVYPQTFFPSARSVGDAQLIRLAAGETRAGLDIQLHATPAFRVRGSVAPLEAVAGRTLRLMLQGTEDLGHGSEAATTMIADSGDFVFDGVAPGAYVLDARGRFAEYNTSAAVGSLPRPPGQLGGALSGGLRASIGPEGTWISFSGLGESGLWGRQTLVVSDSDLAGVRLQMQAAFSISGKYEWEGASKQLANELRVLVAQPANGDLTLGVLPATASPSNTFRIDGLLAGRYVLAASSIVTSGNGRLKSVSCGGIDYTYRAFDPSETGDLANCVVTFTDRATIVTGVVRRAQEMASATLSVIAFPVEKYQWATPGLTPARLKRVPVQSDGTFRIQTLPAGEYFLAAVNDPSGSTWDDPTFLEVASRHSTRILLDWGQSINRMLEVRRER